MQEVGAMTKTAVPVLAVWAAALGSAGALAYTLNRPPGPVAHSEDQFAASSVSTTKVAREPIAPPGYETEVAPTVIATEAPRARARLRAAPAPVRELSDMRCAAGGDLMQGSASQQVRRCE
jgi:hypothetical protein